MREGPGRWSVVTLSYTYVVHVVHVCRYVGRYVCMYVCMYVCKHSSVERDWIVDVGCVRIGGAF
jgi:hypothetical protein